MLGQRQTGRSGMQRHELKFEELETLHVEVKDQTRARALVTDHLKLPPFQIIKVIKGIATTWGSTVRRGFIEDGWRKT